MMLSGPGATPGPLTRSADYPASASTFFTPLPAA